jgi:hypothetical protein
VVLFLEAHQSALHQMNEAGCLEIVKIGEQLRGVYPSPIDFIQSSQLFSRISGVFCI